MIGPTLISGLHHIVVLRPPTKWRQRDAMPQQKAPGPITAAVNRAPVDCLGETRENNKFDQLEARGEGPPKPSFQEIGSAIGSAACGHGSTGAA